jgi:hypothetical protein
MTAGKKPRTKNRQDKASKRNDLLKKKKKS